MDLRRQLNADEGLVLDEENFTKSQEKQITQGKIVWRVVNGFMSAFFLMAAGVQFNDPDPYLWVPIYGIAAILTSCITFRPHLADNRLWQLVYWLHTAFSLGMFVYVVVQLILALSNPNSDGTLNPLTYEEGRELAGLIITSAWLFACKQSPTVRCTLPSCFGCLRSSQFPHASTYI